jgi:hypothetical protein
MEQGICRNAAEMQEIICSSLPFKQFPVIAVPVVQFVSLTFVYVIAVVALDIADFADDNLLSFHPFFVFAGKYG